MNNNCLYVVSGYMRTGTTMMMKALEAGGMYGSYDNSELYELNPVDSTQWDFPRGLEGRLIKVMGGAAVSMAVMAGGIRIVYMKRDPLEIAQSYKKLFGKDIDLKHYDRDIDYIIERLGNRKDVLSLDVFYYSDVVDDPKTGFYLLARHNWPINVGDAAAVIDSALYRSKVAV